MYVKLASVITKLLTSSYCNIVCLLSDKHSNLNGPELLTQKAVTYHTTCTKSPFEGHIHTENPDNAIDRVAKSIGTVHHVYEIVEHDISTNFHLPKELDLMVKQLDEQQVFTDQNCDPRCYHCIKYVLQLKKLRAWISKKVKNYQL